MIDPENKKICIVGIGYVGLTLAVVMAERGFDVIGLEINTGIVAKLTAGEPHFHEVGLEPRLREQLALGRLRFDSDHRTDDVRDCRVFILTVGTPLDDAGRPRMDMVSRAATEVADSMSDGALVVLRSTVKLGTSRDVVKPILDAAGKKYHLAYCPERTIEGNALAELRTLPQIIGGFDQASAWRATQIFQEITPTTIRVSSIEAAEIIKLLDNSYRDLFFAFGNEVALLCDAAGLDGIEVINAANTGYQRTNIARPGLVGGPCLEKDPHILENSMERYDFMPQLISVGRRLNEELPQRIVEMVVAQLTGDEAPDMKITFCGLAFKGRPETDDLRGTPARLMIAAFQERFPKARLCGQDFAVRDEDIEGLGVEPVDVEGAFAGATVVIIANNNAKYQWIYGNRFTSNYCCVSWDFNCYNYHRFGTSFWVL